MASVVTNLCYLFWFYVFVNPFVSSKILLLVFTYFSVTKWQKSRFGSNFGMTSTIPQILGQENLRSNDLELFWHWPIFRKGRALHSVQHLLNENKWFRVKPKPHWKWMILWGVNEFSVPSLIHLPHGANSKPTQPWNHGPRFWIQHGNGIRYQTTIEMLEELQHSVLTGNSHCLTKNKNDMDDSGCKEGDQTNGAIYFLSI